MKITELQQMILYFVEIGLGVLQWSINMCENSFILYIQLTFLEWWGTKWLPVVYTLSNMLYVYLYVQQSVWFMACFSTGRPIRLVRLQQMCVRLSVIFPKQQACVLVEIISKKENNKHQLWFVLLLNSSFNKYVCYSII